MERNPVSLDLQRRCSITWIILYYNSVKKMLRKTWLRAGFEHWTVQPVASGYTQYAIPAPSLFRSKTNTIKLLPRSSG
jgi:hypothetical protein